MSYEKVTQVQSRIIIGVKQTLRAMKNGEVSEIFIADDADNQLIQRVVSLAHQLNVPCQHVDSMKELGAACGIDVGASTVALKHV